MLNPNQAGCGYPDKNLAGVGVAFKLVHALFREYGREAQVPAFMKVVAIGTVADVARLVGENRAIVAIGLGFSAGGKSWFACPHRRCWLRRWQGHDSIRSRFPPRPRINAAGRMDAAPWLSSSLIRDLSKRAGLRIISTLETRNETVQQEIIDLAVAQLKDPKDSFVTVLAGEGWHRGVIGIAASKIAERFNRPCVVLSVDGDVAHGSGRSIEAYHLLNGLTACSDLFEKFGGHSHAAGITIRPERIEEFRRRLNEHAASCLTPEDLEPSVSIDLELAPESVTFPLARELEALEPFGAGNPRPVFMTEGLRLLSEPTVIKERHLKFRVAGPQNRPLEAIGGIASSLRGKLPS